MAGPAITTARVVVSGGNFSFIDRSNNPAFSTTLSDFGGTISGLSSAELARADVDLAGRIGVAPLKVSGQINPLGGEAFTDLKITLTGLELPPFTLHRAAMPAIASTRASSASISPTAFSARELTAENAFAFDQFYLGQNVESPDAIKLPLKLALAILRDRNGRIAEQRLDPRQPRRSGLPLRPGALARRLQPHREARRPRRSPFLGSLFGGGHDLSAVELASGSAEPSPEAQARLEGLAWRRSSSALACVSRSSSLRNPSSIAPASKVGDSMRCSARAKPVNWPPPRPPRSIRFTVQLTPEGDDALPDRAPRRTRRPDRQNTRWPPRPRRWPRPLPRRRSAMCSSAPTGGCSANTRKPARSARRRARPRANARLSHPSWPRPGFRPRSCAPGARHDQSA